MHDLAFADAVRQAPVKILKLPMLDYSVGHELLLQRYRNPLLAPKKAFDELDASIQRSSIIRAALICSRTWNENKKREWFLGIYLLMIRKEDHALSIAQFRNYRDAGSTYPRPKKQESKGRELGSPLMSRLVAYGGSIFGNSIFDKPLGMIQWMYFAHCEQEGCLEIENESEKDFRELVGEVI